MNLEFMFKIISAIMFFEFAICAIIFDLEKNGFIYFDKNLGILRDCFLITDFNRMKINFSFFRIF